MGPLQAQSGQQKLDSKPVCQADGNLLVLRRLYEWYRSCGPNLIQANVQGVTQQMLVRGEHNVRLPDETIPESHQESLGPENQDSQPFLNNRTELKKVLLEHSLWQRVYVWSGRMMRRALAQKALQNKESQCRARSHRNHGCRNSAAEYPGELPSSCQTW